MLIRDKTKFQRITIEDVDSSYGPPKEVDLITIMTDIVPVSLNCSTTSLNLPDFFKLKEMKESLVEEEQATTMLMYSQRVLTIESFDERLYMKNLQ